MACFSQNLIPVHIAFIPILIPALLKVLTELKVDRRLVTCIITFGLITPYMWIPAGFGKIYHDVLQTNAAQSGLTFDVTLIPKAMTIPAIGMIIGLCVAVFITYRNLVRMKQNKFILPKMKSFPIQNVALLSGYYLLLLH